MKKFNRILAALLIIALIPIHSISVFSYNGDSIDITKSNHEFLSMLGIVNKDEIIDYNRTVSRAEFTSLAVSMLNLNHKAENDETFSDVDSENIYSSDIYTAYKFGLLKGTSQTTFSPDSPITYAAAIKIIVAMLGYEEYAFLNGGYPNGYLMQAKSMDILYGVESAAINDTLSYSSVINLIANSLVADIRMVNSVGDDYVQTVVAKGENCLTQYFNLSYVNGVVETAGYSSVIDGYTNDESYVEINNMSLKSNIPGVEKYLGLNVDAWYDDVKRSFIAIRTKNTNNVITIDAKTVLSYSDFKIKVETDEIKGTTKSYNLNKGYTYVLNGRTIAATESDFLFENGTLTLIDNNSDNIYDIVLALKKNYVVVRGINSSTKTVYDQKQGDIGLVLQNENGYHCTIIKDGHEVDSSSIESNTVLEVAVSGDGYLSNVVICTDSVKGTVTEIGNDTIYVSGTAYETTEYFKKYFTPELGQSGTFLLDTSGKLVYISGLYIDSVQYGYFLDYGRNNNSLSDETVQLKIFTDFGDVKIFELAEKITFDGNAILRTNEKIKNQFKPDRTEGDAVPVYQLIRFATDSNGLIKLIDTSSELDDNLTDPLDKYAATISAENSLTRYVNATKPIDSTQRPKLVSNAYWRKVGNAFIPHFTLGDTVMIEVPETLRDNNAPDEPYADTAFRIIGTGNLPNYDYVYVDAYDYDESMIPKIVVLYRGTEKPGETRLVEPDMYDPIHLVEKVVDCVTDSGDITKRVYSYADETFHITDIAVEVVDSLVQANLIPLPGEAVRLSFNGDEINGISRDIRDIKPGSVTVNITDSKIGKTCTSAHTYITGKVFSCTDGSNVVIQFDFYPMPEEGTTDYKNSPYAFPEDGLCSIRVDSATTVVIYNIETGLVEHGDVTQIADIRSVGEESASYVCVGLDGYDPEMLIIYR